MRPLNRSLAAVHSINIHCFSTSLLFLLFSCQSSPMSYDMFLYPANGITVLILAFCPKKKGALETLMVYGFLASSVTLVASIIP